MAKILLLNGPNLNMLGIREPSHYGTDSLDSINQKLESIASENNYTFEAFQSNSESDLIDKIHQSYGNTQFILINPAAFTHTSVAIRDAIAAVNIPFIEIHLSNVHAREPFRKHSYFSDIAVGVISGLGKQSYLYAMQYAIDYFDSNIKNTQTNK